MGTSSILAAALIACVGRACGHAYDAEALIHAVLQVGWVAMFRYARLGALFLCTGTGEEGACSGGACAGRLVSTSSFYWFTHYTLFGPNKSWWWDGGRMQWWSID
eukprot:scaffold11505_cov90-Isochrysis_galbana.AAC.1